MSYAESDDEGEDDDDKIFAPSKNGRGRAAKRAKTIASSPKDEDNFEQNDDAENFSDEGEEAKPGPRSEANGRRLC